MSSAAATRVLSFSDMAGVVVWLNNALAEADVLMPLVDGMQCLPHLQCCMAGPRCHPSKQWGAHVALFLAGFKTSAFCPGGWMGVLLQSNVPSKTSQADFFSLALDFLSEFRVVSA